MIDSPLGFSLPVSRMIHPSGGLVMRTAISCAALPRRLRWQAAFTIKNYTPLTSCVWHHTFVSDAQMTNWRGGSDLILRWVRDGSPNGKAKTTNIVGLQRGLALVGRNGEGYAFNKALHPSHRYGDHLSSL